MAGGAALPSRVSSGRRATQSRAAEPHLCSTHGVAVETVAAVAEEHREPGVQRGAEAHPPAAEPRDRAAHHPAGHQAGHRRRAQRPGRRVAAEPQPAITAGRPVTKNSVPTAHRARRIVYAPDLDGRADPGEIVWTWVVYEDDPTRGKDRPVLVVGRDSTHPARPDAVQPGPSRATTATGSASARGSWDYEGRAELGPAGPRARRARGGHPPRGRDPRARDVRDRRHAAARRLLLELTSLSAAARHIGISVGPPSGSVISPVTSNPKRW